ncbi:MAG: PEGA domain-containing protein [Ignavibacteriales bacterium]|nr:PEGA domain-containing protein [Ignavibacteriales bacterium]MCF8307180.1 PEGA domain-containing protein [Ignavibacteriales bacterium]MCF8315185.1 PEGA domain-containing protein [Ignavibacteriales bacterium]MCF8438460.1 PEGA domain-containing protein [Ignavibacteriales bacterium]
MKKIFTLILLFTSILNAQEISKLSVAGKPEFAPDILLNRDIKDANYEVCAGLMILTDLTGLQFDSYNGIVKLLSDKPGQYLLFLSESERVVEVFKEGYKPLKMYLPDLGIKLQKGVSWKVSVTGDKKDNLIPVNFIIEPVEARLSIDDQRKDFSSAVLLSEGKHSMRIEFEGYKGIIEDVEVNLKNNLFSRTLQKVTFAPFSISTNPKGAAFYLGDNIFGITDSSFFTYPGEYQLRVEMPLHIPINEQITISENSENKFSFDLSRNTGTLELSYSPAGALFLLNNRIYPPGNFDLEPGIYFAEISAPFHITQKDTILIGRGVSTQKNYILDKDKNTGIVDLEITPSFAGVKVNQTDRGQVKRLELSPGKFEIEVYAEGYFTETRTSLISIGSRDVLTFNLKPKVGSLQLSVNKPEAETIIYKGDIEVYRWQGLIKQENFPVGNYKYETKLTGYRTERGEFAIENNKFTLKEVIMQEGNDLVDFSFYGPANIRIYLDGKEFSRGTRKIESGDKNVQVYDSVESRYLFDEYMPISDRENNKFYIRQQSAAIHYLPSVIIPGLGQTISGRWIPGLIYSSAFLGAGAYYLISIYDYYGKTDEFKSKLNRLQIETDPVMITKLNRSVEEQNLTLTNKYNLVNILLYTTAGIYALNLIDMLFFTRSNYSVSISADNKGLSLLPAKTPGGYGMNLVYGF